MNLAHKLGAALSLGAILIGAGCARVHLPIPGLGSTPPTTPLPAEMPVYSPDTTALMVEVVTDSAEQEPAPRAIEEPRARRERPPAVVAKTPADSLIAGPPVPPPTVSLDLPQSQRTRLATAYRLDLAAADSLRDELGARTISTQTREKLRTVDDLIAQARAAMEAQDLEGAANLAHKARLLVLELLPR